MKLVDVWFCAACRKWTPVEKPTCWVCGGTRAAGAQVGQQEMSDRSSERMAARVAKLAAAVEQRAVSRYGGRSAIPSVASVSSSVGRSVFRIGCLLVLTIVGLALFVWSLLFLSALLLRI